MRTISSYQREITDLRRLNERLKSQLAEALEEVARNHAKKMQADINTKKRGEFHHRVFEQLCPAPDLSQITIFK